MEIREARKEDCKGIQKLVRELAEYEKMPDGPRLNSEDFERDGFETQPPLFHAYVLVDDGKIIGYALYYYSYSAWVGKAMFLEDFYIRAGYRNQGLGSRLFDVVAKKAALENCSRLELVVLNWNPAKRLYERKGAIDLTEAETWHLYRLDREALKKFRD